MKKIIVTCALISATSVMSFAQASKTVNANNTPASHQAGPTAEQIAERQTLTLEKQLNLNPEQRKTIYAAELDVARQRMQMRAAGVEMGEGQAMQMAMGLDQKIKAALTAEQYAKYEKMRPDPSNSKAAKH